MHVAKAISSIFYTTYKVHLVEPEDELDGEMLAGVLVHVSLFPGMSQAARDAVQSMALILVGVTSGEAGTLALSTCMERMVSEFKAAINSITQSAIDEVKTASSALTATSTQFQATATRMYLHQKGRRQTLQQRLPPPWM